MGLTTLFRRSKETTVTTEPVPSEPHADPVAMRFLTQGGATVELRAQTFRKPYNSRQDDGGRWVHDWRDANGFNWRCLGCDTVGRRFHTLRAYDESEPDESRRDANDHAEKCRAMPHPTT